MRGRLYVIKWWIMIELLGIRKKRILDKISGKVMNLIVREEG